LVFFATKCSFGERIVIEATINSIETLESKYCMKCPTCISVNLLMTERKGIEIDYCPSCRGVWLDRGELDKFIQQSEHPTQMAPSPSVERSRRDLASPSERYEDDRKYDDRRYENREYREDDRPHHRYGKKKESFWSELFDFD
jgi:uncharacterized protein